MEELTKRVTELEALFKEHEHNRADSQAIKGRNIARAPQTELTTASVGSLTTGGGATLSTADADILNNALTRISEIESKLQTLGFIL